MKNTSIETVKELSEIEDSKAHEIRTTFLPMANMLESFEEQYMDVINLASSGITPLVAKKASKLRKSISKVRIESEKLRKDKKKGILLAGRAIDGVGNILKYAVEEKENALKDIENHFEIELKKKNDAIQLIRETELKKYTHDEMDTNSIMPLYVMPDDVWEAYLSKKKTDFEELKEAKFKAEKDRLELEASEKLSQEKLRSENEKIKKENDRIKKENEEIKNLSEKKDLELKEAISNRLTTNQIPKPVKDLFTIKTTDKEKANQLIEDLTEIKNSYKFTSQENIYRMEKVKTVIDNIIIEFGRV